MHASRFDEDTGLLKSGLLSADEKRTWNKRKDTSGLSAASKRAALNAPAGSKTAQGGIVRPRINEVLEPSAAVNLCAVPDDVALVAAVASAHTPGAHNHLICAADLEGELGAVTASDSVSSSDGKLPQPTPMSRRAFYALLDGHGGRSCAEWVAQRLPVLLSARLRGVHESAAIKEAIKAACAECDETLLSECERRGWADGCCALGLLLDLHPSPPRAYVLSLGSSQAFACCKEEGQLGVGKTIPVSKSHTGADPKERKRLELAGGVVEAGLVNGRLRAARSFGDASEKSRGLIATPDVTSFEVKVAQRFVTIASAGLCQRKGFAGRQLVDELSARFRQMDARRVELEATLSDDAKLALLPAARVMSLAGEYEKAHERGVVSEVVQKLGETKEAEPVDFSVLVVRLLQPKDKAAPSVLLAAEAAEAAEEEKAEREQAAAAAAAAVAAEARQAAEVDAPPVRQSATSSVNALGGHADATNGNESGDDREEDEEEAAMLAALESKRAEQRKREETEAAPVVDFF